MTSTARKLSAGALGVLFFCLFLALGTWQLERRVWKLALIDRVERRVHAAAVSAPSRSEWPYVKAASHEYRHVRATGVFLPISQTRVRALTELGSGFWVMTPLRLTDGSIVLVNRGFVAEQPPRADPADATESRDAGGSHDATESHDADGSPDANESRAAAGSNDASTSPDAVSRRTVTVIGLLRMTELGGGFMRPNNPSDDRWYSRDVRAIAAARGLAPVAPYFIDADDSVKGDAGADSPVGGLTVIAFHNDHLMYALTWYTLALMVPAALWFARRSQVPRNRDARP